MNNKKISQIFNIVLLAGIILIYALGLQAEVLSSIQRAILATGLVKPDTDINAQKLSPADYSFTLTTLEGETLDFANLQGKTIFMNFWATWCPPCLAEMPGIERLYRQIADKEITFVMIALDKDANKVKEFIDKKKYTFPIYRLTTTLPNVYQSQAIPTTFVISAKGNIIMKETGIADYDNQEFRNFLLKISQS